MNIKLTILNKKVFNFLADWPEKQFFSKEISDRLGISLGGAHNSLKALLKAGVVVFEQKGNMKFFKINFSSPLFKQLRSAGIVESLLPLVKKIKNHCLNVILFGSAARGEQTAKSDIDIFILTNNPLEIRKLLPAKINRLLLKAIIKKPNEWSEMEIKEPEFFREIKNGIKLYESRF
ncbi:MAG: nucleotidyltransferase domain-containing protein [Patescibacteria group bacterium]